MKRKIIALLLGTAMLCAVTACDKNEGSVSNTDSSNNSESTTGSTEDSLSTPSAPDSSSEESTGSTSEPSESNTIQSVKAEIEVDGQLISLPCKVKDINNIKIDQEYSFVVAAQDDGSYVSSAILYYNNIRVGGIFLEGDCSGVSDLSEEKVIGLIINDKSVPISYMGLTYNSDKDDVIAKLGEPDSGENSYMCYYYGEKGSVSFFLDSFSYKIDGVDIFLHVR